MGEVKLLGSANSPFSRRVEWALKIKGVEYELIVVDTQSNKSPLLLESNPVHKKIPVLIHNGKAIAESLIILEYIDETFEGPPILPKDPYHRAMSRFWANFLDDKCRTTLMKAYFSKGEELEKAKKEADEVLKILDNELKGKKYFVGDQIGFADIVANMMAFWVGISEEAFGVVLITSEKYPNFCVWRDEYINCSKVQENLPSRDVLLAYFQARFPAAPTAPK